MVDDEWLNSKNQANRGKKARKGISVDQRLGVCNFCHFVHQCFCTAACFSPSAPFLQLVPVQGLCYCIDTIDTIDTRLRAQEA